MGEGMGEGRRLGARRAEGDEGGATHAGRVGLDLGGDRRMSDLTARPAGSGESSGLPGSAEPAGPTGVGGSAGITGPARSAGITGPARSAGTTGPARTAGTAGTAEPAGP